MTDRQPTVWITQNLSNSYKNFDDARRFGNPRVVFTKPVSNDFGFDPVSYAQRELANYSDEDYILLAGDPLATGIVFEAALAASDDQRLRVLRWDKKTLRYNQVDINFESVAQ